jgi:trimeric autotransporter adhesin
VVISSTTPSNGTAPAGTVTFNTVVPKTVALVPGFDPNGNAIATASTTIGVTEVPASGQVNAVYNPTTPNYLASTSIPVAFTSRTPKKNDTPSTTSFKITDNIGTYNTGGTLSFPAQDSLTLNIKVTGDTPSNSYLLIYANGILLCTPAGIIPSSNGTASFTIPQQNGYLGLPSGQVQLSVVYAGWTHSNSGSNGIVESEPSSSTQLLTIVDDRTSADFSLQSDTTVNQGSPLLASGTTQATYNLRLTSLYNFQSAYGSTPINLSCSVVGYSVAGVRSTPVGVACGFNSALTATTASVTLGSGYASQTLYVGAASTYGIANNTAPSAPASRWWMATGGTTLACIFLLGLPARRRKWQSLLGACVLVIAGFGMTGCGVTAMSGPDQQGYKSLNGGSNTSQATTGTPVPAGTYTVLVTASTTANTTITHTLPVQVLVGTTN